MELEIYTELHKGEMNEHQWERFREFVANIGDGFLYVYASKKRGAPTSPQRKYYWGVLLKIMEEQGSGYTRQEWHDIFKEMFLKKEEHDEDGNLVGSHYLSSESLDTKEREEYHENIRRWASIEQGIIIPEPNE